MADGVSVDLSGQLGASLPFEGEQLVLAGKTVIRQRVSGGKKSLRRAVVRAGLGERLGNAIRSDVVDRGDSIEGVIFSRATTKRPGGPVDLLQVYRSGTIIRPRQGTYLAIAEDAAGKGPRGRMKSPEDFPRGSLVFVPSKDGRTASLIDKASGEKLFTLVRQATVRVRLDFTTPLARMGKDLAPRIIAEWGRRIGRIADRAS
jgi:hypothetical protein